MQNGMITAHSCLLFMVADESETIKRVNIQHLARYMGYNTTCGHLDVIIDNIFQRA